MSTAESQQEQPVVRFKPGMIDDAKKAAVDLAEDFHSRKQDKTKAAILHTITNFEEVVGKIPDLFAKGKEYLLASIGDFKDRMLAELKPVEAVFEAKEDEFEAAVRAKAERETAVLQQLAQLKTEMDTLESETENLNQSHSTLNAEYSAILHNKKGFVESLRNLKPGRRKALLEAARLQATKAFDDKGRSRSEFVKKRSQHSSLKSQWDTEKYRADQNIESLRRDLEKAQKALVKKIDEINELMEIRIIRLQENIESCAQGGNLNEVDITNIDVRSRTNGIAAMVSKDVDLFTGELATLAAYKASPQGLHPVSADPGDKNQTSFEYFVDDSAAKSPTLFYTGQILETAKDSVSRRFVSCALVEVFSPKSSRHVAFHLPPRWIKDNFGQTKTAHFLEYNPLFFYQNLEKFVEREGCDFADLDVKIVSGLNVPPDQVAASLKAIGCDEKRIGVFQLPADNFSTLTIADRKKVLVVGEEVKFLQPGETTDAPIYTTIGGNNGRGHWLYTAPGQSRYVV